MFKCKIHNLFLIKNFITRSLSTQQKVSSTVSPAFLSQLSALKINNNSTNNPWIYQQNDEVKLPLINNTIFDLPNGWSKGIPLPAIETPGSRTNDIIEEPESGKEMVKEAARLIVIRRKKMKKHKLRKLRKRMKFEWAKLRQRRELKKEKLFQSGLIQQCKEAEAFDAEKYIDERINKFNEVMVPRNFKEKQLTEQ